ncbi:MAG: phospho-N-acetylmuramoyl-pentapeptide-transferase [Candidatus Latescibacteria bacterium]|nr:phospho-N-acetylmuramoyl-pentapeptide-transferase [Candidatus Latescibacterota bacterium]
MIYYLGNYLRDLAPIFSFLRLVDYISFRAIAAAITAFLLTLILGRRLIRELYIRKKRDVVRDYGVMSVNDKKGTPTMGGILIVAAVFLSALLWCDPINRFVGLTLLALLWFAAIGLTDDVLKIRHQDSDKGLSQGRKILLQGIYSALLGVIYLVPALSPFPPEIASNLYLPFVKFPVVDLGWVYLPFIIFTLLAISNSVNFADGLDGLAVVPASFIAAVYGVFAYVIGNTIYSGYLHFFYLPGVWELTVVCAAIFGAGIGFLWYNTYPAQIFMGDTGSMALGGVLGTLAVLLKQEFLFVLIGGIFVTEAFSVFIQEKIGIHWLGRRLFYRAPIHHTYQYRGLAETKVVVRFWIVSGLLALAGLATLKIR